MATTARAPALPLPGRRRALQLAAMGGLALWARGAWAFGPSAGLDPPWPALFGVDWREAGDPVAIHPRAEALLGRTCRPVDEVVRAARGSAGYETGRRLVAGWARMVEALRGAPAAEQLRAVNEYVNTVPFAADAYRFGRADHWACPAEFFFRGGDCEDYSIAKFATLRLLGHPAARMRLVLGGQAPGGEPHACLAVNLGGAVHILDNRRRAVRLDTEIRDFRPLLALGAERAWLVR